jgi:hypothetical protein
MAADYAGAVAAIRDYFVVRWVVDGSPRTPVGYVNESDPLETTPDLNVPWVLFEVVPLGSRIEGVGTSGGNTIIYSGDIKGYVFVPSGEGIDRAYELAVALGEIFRNRLFYDGVTPGCCVRTGYEMQGQPRIDAGVARDEDGNWFNVTATIPFDYWHRG